MSIESMIADTIRESIEEAVKNAVTEALVPIRQQLSVISQNVSALADDTGGAREADILSLENEVRELKGSIDYLADQLEGQDRADSLEIGRLQLRLMQAERKAS